MSIIRNALTLLLLSFSQAQAQDVALLLFDFESRQEFAGCFNCNRYDDGSVCNRYGDYGSRYSDYPKHLEPLWRFWLPLRGQ